MDALRKEAYRHLLYVAVLDMRCSPPRPRWRSLARWREIYGETCRVKDLAHAFHNLALYSRGDFEGFDETMFWRDLDCAVRDYRDRSDFDFRKIFNEYLDGRRWPA